MPRKKNPYSYNPETTPGEIERLTGQGFNMEQVAFIMRVSQSTVSRWAVRHAEVKDALKRGQHAANSQVIGAIYRKAIGAPARVQVEATCPGCGRAFRHDAVIPSEKPDVTAQIWWTKNRAGWSDQQTIKGDLKLSASAEGILEQAKRDAATGKGARPPYRVEDAEVVIAVKGQGKGKGKDPNTVDRTGGPE